MNKGPSIKDVGRPHPRGEGGLVKSGLMRTQGGGGSVAKSGRPQIQIFTKILEVKIVSCVLKTAFDSSTNH